MSGKVEKDKLDKSNSNLVARLYKHVNDWFQDHPGAKFISPRDFQNAYPEWDKYSSDSFRNVFYKVKTRIKDGEIFQNLIHSYYVELHSDNHNLLMLRKWIGRRQR